MSTEPQASRQQLEERLTYCEHLVDTLNRVVTDLQKRVLAVELQNRHLVREFQQRQAATLELGMTAETPPHY